MILSRRKSAFGVFVIGGIVSLFFIFVSLPDSFNLISSNYEILTTKASYIFNIQNSHNTINERKIKRKVLKQIVAEFVNENNATINLNDGNIIHLGDDIPESQALNIVIATRGRSGSSFLGHLLNSYPGTFYTFEPLWKKGEDKKIYNKNILERNQAIEIIQRPLKCKPPEYDTNGFCVYNFRFWDTLKDTTWEERFQQYQKLFSDSCAIFPIRLVKTIRFAFEDTEKLLLDPQIGNTLKIIFLFRDPRGIFQSYVSKVHWCNETDNTDKSGYSELCDISSFCNMIHDDVQAAMNIQERYPDQTRILRYEDLCQNPQKIANNLMTFLNLKQHQGIEKFINDNAYTDIAPNSWNKFKTKRNSSLMAFEWKKHLGDEYIADIQQSCKIPMKLLGYYPMQKIQSDKLNETYPLLVKSTLI